VQDDKEYLVLGSFAVDWSVHGSRWLDRLALALKHAEPSFEMRGHRYDGTTIPFIQFTIGSTRGADQWNFLIAPMADSAVVVVDPDSLPPAAPTSAVASAARSAVDWLKNDGPQHEWSAVLGVSPDSPGGSVFGLDGKARIGSFTLQSAEHFLVEASQVLQNPSFMSHSINASVPISVRGKSRGYSWTEAASSAARDLNRLCALLSLEWNTCLVIRESPAPLEWGERKVPERVFWQDVGTGQGLPDFDKVERKKAPGWLKVAWESTGSPNSRLARALHAHYEGLRMAGAHQSFALVAFVASIEAVGNNVYKDRFCECGEHKDVARKFRHTLMLVLAEDEARELARAYSPRSNIVHQGRLYGDESSIGGFSPRIWSSDSTIGFWITLHKMRDASRKLLIRAVQGDLPSRSNIPADPVL
jgi:hypothetical protein